MRFVILGLLLSGPLSLYDIQRRFAAGLAHFYSASSGSIERALRALLDDGEVTREADAESSRGRRVYHITSTGEAAWRAWMLDPAAAGSDLETTALAKVFLLARLPDRADRRAVLAGLRERAERARADLRAIAAEVDVAAADLTTAERELFVPQRATLDYGLRAHDVLVAWLREREEDEER